jgi:hypothetical protein
MTGLEMFTKFGKHAAHLSTFMTLVHVSCVLFLAKVTFQKFVARELRVAAHAREHAFNV